jgi:hypothetical protein
MLELSALFILIGRECNKLHKTKQLSEHSLSSGPKISVSTEIDIFPSVQKKDMRFVSYIIYFGHKVLFKEWPQNEMHVYASHNFTLCLLQQGPTEYGDRFIYVTQILTVLE